MDPRAIANHIDTLNKVAFDAVVTLVLNSVFKLKSIDVDGPVEVTSPGVVHDSSRAINRDQSG